MNPERRKFDRVECYLIVRDSRRATEERDLIGVTRNVSAGGAMIETDSTIQIGSFLEMAFLVDDEKQVWETKGTVVWARQDRGKTIIGVQFNQPLESNWRESLLG
jgi:c-di-GMP-binding flagellar brake protein YcgR